MEKLRKEKQVTDSYPIVRHIPVIAVRKDKADGINSIADLAASNLRIGMGDPKAIALGRSGEVLLDASGYGDALREKVIVRAATIKHLSMYLLNGEVDAAVIGRADAMKNHDKLIILPSPEGSPKRWLRWRYSAPVHPRQKQNNWRSIFPLRKGSKPSPIMVFCRSDRLMHTDSGITDVSGDEMGAGAPVTVVVSDYQVSAGVTVSGNAGVAD